jgi:hypothetical protein
VEGSSKNLILVSKQVFAWKERIEQQNPRRNADSGLGLVSETPCSFCSLTIFYKVHKFCSVKGEKFCGTHNDVHELITA